MQRLSLLIALGFAISLFSGAEALAQPSTKASSLDDLLKRVRQGWTEQATESAKREQAFRKAKADQQALLTEAKASRNALESRSTTLEQEFQANEVKIAELEDTLRRSLGNMGELFGVIRQIAGDTRSHFDTSIVSAQFPDRDPALAKLAQSKKTPAIEDLQQLWFNLQHEMTESGKVSRFEASVVDPNGIERKRSVVRVGAFNAISDGRYLRWMPEVKKLAELERQPASRYLATAEDLEDANQGVVRFAIDPSRGSILSLLVQTPSFIERLQFGGIIGYIIISLGLVAFVLGLFRLVYLGKVNGRVLRQKKDPTPNSDNPLGRIIGVSGQNPDLDTETLELKLDEAILREQADLDTLLWAIKVVSVAAPLLGLLGTVTGMIRTFQAITLFGTGDPKLMAGGISEALVTTMLGLIVAIPLVLLHSWLKTTSRRIVETLGEQSMGLVATRAEEAQHGNVGS